YIPYAGVESISGSYTEGTTSYFINDEGCKFGHTTYTLNGDCTVKISCSTPTGQSRGMCAFVKV
ncbi:MAG: hypothetical protein IJV14_11085, partial [Lachnospiraceae bacterium]|nr:hypothetical protein [Lachnospiraceae bacterium]